MKPAEIAILRARGQFTLPPPIRRALGVGEGDPLELVLTEDGLLIRPKKLVDASQAWFWTERWQAGEREASADIAAGRTTRYPSDRAFLDSLASEGAPAYRKPAAKKGRAAPRAKKGRAKAPAKRAVSRKR